jgi:predicted ATPase
LEEKHTLQNASVIGRVFQQRVLERLYENKVAINGQLNDSLAELQRRGFIQPGQSSEEREYIFKHAITHEVAYNSLLIGRRKLLHRRVGDAIEALFPDRLDEFSPTLGYHFEKAEAREKAIRYLRQAAQRAQATFANAEALAFHRSALRQLELLLAARPDQTLRQAIAQIQESIGDIQHLIGRQAEAREAYESALRTAPQRDAACSSRLRRNQAKAWIIERDFDRAGNCYDEAEKVLENRVVEHTRPRCKKETFSMDSSSWLFAVIATLQTMKRWIPQLPQVKFAHWRSFCVKSELRDLFSALLISGPDSSTRLKNG